MWVPNKVLEWFRISKDTVDTQRAELASLRVERDLLKLQLSTANNHFDWLRVRVNQLEAERVQLIDKAYGIKIPYPEIARSTPPTFEFNSTIFEDLGDNTAKELGLPVYGN